VIEYKYKSDVLIGQWYTDTPELCKSTDIDEVFTLVDFRINDEIFIKNTQEFQKALVWEKLSG